jgi:hypothetical protein
VTEFNELIGKTITEIKVSDDKERIDIVTSEGKKYVMYHCQNCCETVKVEDITGDLSDLIGNPILKAEERTNDKENPSDAKPETIEYQDSFTWTFYELSTIKGSVTIRWYGESNGYYSEIVEFKQVGSP